MCAQGDHFAAIKETVALDPLEIADLIPPNLASVFTDVPDDVSYVL